MDEIKKFNEEKEENIRRLGADPSVKDAAMRFMIAAAPYKYSYNFSWLGRPIIAYPMDMIVMQELIWRVQPDLIIETGIAHGGSIIYYASLLELIGGKGKVLGIDIDIREHNRTLIESHPMSKRIRMVQGSSIDPEVADKVAREAALAQRVLVCLDSNHTHEHVLQELKLYAPLVSRDSYCVVFDTLVEDAPEEFFHDRPWGKGNNPKTAVYEFLQSNPGFVIEKSHYDKSLISVAPDGFLRRIH